MAYNSDNRDNGGLIYVHNVSISKGYIDSIPIEKKLVNPTLDEVNTLVYERYYTYHDHEFEPVAVIIDHVDVFKQWAWYKTMLTAIPRASAMNIMFVVCGLTRPEMDISRYIDVWRT